MAHAGCRRRVPDDARGRAFDPAELEESWAAGLWLRSFDEPAWPENRRQTVPPASAQPTVIGMVRSSDGVWIVSW